MSKFAAPKYEKMNERLQIDGGAIGRTVSEVHTTTVRYDSPNPIVRARVFTPVRFEDTTKIRIDNGPKKDPRHMEVADGE